MTNRRDGAPLRRHLLHLIAAGFLPLFIVAAVGIWLLFQEREQTAHARALEITRALSTAVSSELNMGKDHTLFATATGHVKYAKHGPKQKSTVSIEPVQQQ